MKKIIGMLSIVATMAISAITFAGATGGPKYVNNSVVLGSSTDYYTVWFNRGEFSRVIVRGDGSSDIDCYVVDRNGYRLTQDLNSTDFCDLRFTLFLTSPVTIYIVNLGDEANMYSVRTN